MSGLQIKQSVLCCFLGKDTLRRSNVLISLASIADLTTNVETVFFETYLSFLRAVHSMLTESVNLKKIMAMNLLLVLVADWISHVSVLFNT